MLFVLCKTVDEVFTAFTWATRAISLIVWQHCKKRFPPEIYPPDSICRIGHFYHCKTDFIKTHQSWFAFPLCRTTTKLFFFSSCNSIRQIIGGWESGEREVRCQRSCGGKTGCTGRIFYHLIISHLRQICKHGSQVWIKSTCSAVKCPFWLKHLSYTKKCGMNCVWKWRRRLDIVQIQNVPPQAPTHTSSSLSFSVFYPNTSSCTIHADDNHFQHKWVSCITVPVPPPLSFQQEQLIETQSGTLFHLRMSGTVFWHRFPSLWSHGKTGRNENRERRGERWKEEMKIE